MNLVKHILKKDIRRLRIFLVFWVAIVLFVAVLCWVKATTVAGDFSRQDIFQLLYGLAVACRYTLLVLIIPFLFHSEPLTGVTAFWFTRPIQRLDMMKSKLAFVGIFLLLIPSLADIALYAVSGVSVPFILMAVPELWFNSIVLILPFVVAAVLTRSFGFYVLLYVVYTITFLILTITVKVTQIMSQHIDEPVSAALLDSRRLLSSLAIIFFCAVIIVLQYRTRKTIRSYVLVGVQIAWVFYLGTYCPWSVYSQPENILSTTDLSEIKAGLDMGQSFYISDTVSNRSEEPQKEIRGRFHFLNLPENSLGEIKKVYATFNVNGEKVRSYTHSEKRGRFVQKDVMASAIAPLNLIRDNRSYFGRTALLRISTEDYKAYRDKPGRYAANLRYNIYQYCPLITLPLKVGETYMKGSSTFTIDSVLHETYGCSVILREQHFALFLEQQRTPKEGLKYTYLLVNPDRQEAFLPKDFKNVPYSGFQSGGILKSEARNLRYVSDGVNADLHPIDEEWLENAQLMIVQVRWLGHSAVEVKTDDTFSFGESRISRADRMEPRVPDHGNKDVLSEIELPGNATRDEVKAYIQKIHTISATQSGYSWRDPQVEMLAKIGSENLDLLIPFARRGSSRYEGIVIKRLALPEHKELILDSLPDIPNLSEVVLKFGWEKDARDILLKELADMDGDGSVDVSVVRAVARLEDPETYPALINYFVYGMNKSQTCAAIKDLPGIDLAYAFPKAWEEAKSSSFQLQRLIAPALEFGLEDALGAIVEYLHKEPLSDYWKDHFHTDFMRHTGVQGTREELREWYLTNKGALRFDPETKMFVGEKSIESMLDSDAEEVLAPSDG